MKQRMSARVREVKGNNEQEDKEQLQGLSIVKVVNKGLTFPSFTHALIRGL
jgi:hypothetical protein